MGQQPKTGTQLRVTPVSLPFVVQQATRAKKCLSTKLTRYIFPNCMFSDHLWIVSRRFQ